MKKTRILVMVSVLTIVLSLSLNGSVSIAQEVIKIGNIMPLTGPGSAWGIPCDSRSCFRCRNIE